MLQISKLPILAYMQIWCLSVEYECEALCTDAAKGKQGILLHSHIFSLDVHKLHMLQATHKAYEWLPGSRCAVGPAKQQLSYNSPVVLLCFPASIACVLITVGCL